VALTLELPGPNMFLAELADAPRAFGEAQSLYHVTGGPSRPAGHAELAAVVQQVLLPEPAFARCTRVVSSA
jgi:hypothetical protein